MSNKEFIEEIKKKGLVYAYKYYGHFVDVDDLYEYKKKYIVDLKVEYPLYIMDDKNLKIFDSRVLDIHNIGSLIYTEKGDLIEYPERLECELAVKERLKYWREQIEKIIISETSKHIAQITRYSNFWNPIIFIISAIVDNKKVHEIDFENSKPKNTLRYLRFLKQSNILIYENGYYDFSPEVKIKYKDELKTEEKLKEWILSVIIEKDYKTIRDVFSITQLIPIIQTENVYYIPSLNADELLYKKLNSLTRYYVEWYDNKASWLDVQYWLKELVRVDVMDYEDGYYFGNKKMFNKMMKRKDEVPDSLPSMPL